MRHGKEILTSVCDAASMLARRLGLGRGVQDCVEQQFERWDGKGPTAGADEVALPARVGEVATQAVLFLDADGPRGGARHGAAARRWLVRPRGRGRLLHVGRGTDGRARRRRSVAGAAGVGAGAGRAHRGVTIWTAWRGVSPTWSTSSRRTRWATRSEVAELAEAAARSLELGGGRVVTLRRAALLHDLGRVGVSSGIWDKKGPLTRSEWEQIRLHPYHTERILSCSPILAPLGWIAGLHHERLDGSGYHHGVSAPGDPDVGPDPGGRRHLPDRHPGPPAPARTHPGAGRRASHRGGRRGPPRRRLRGGRHRGGRAAARRGYAGTGPPASATARSRCSGCSPAACRTRRSPSGW